MSKKLAIRGHATRGNEVIEILKMLGGKNKCDSPADNLGLCYLIDDEFDICAHYFGYDDYEDGELNIFTLEEFLEEYPFKVGELKDLECDHISCVITEMRWNEQAQCVEYHAEFGSNDYGWYRIHDFCSDYQIEEPYEVISGIYLNSCDYADEVELNLGDYEIEVRDGRTFAVKKKPKYPDNYEECVRIAKNIHGYDIHIDAPAYRGEVESFIKLLICRDAYWKILGEEMGLGKPWKPDWKHLNRKFYCIYNSKNNIVKNVTYGENKILAFPTEEMRDTFYENFKDLIGQCKELL